MILPWGQRGAIEGSGVGKVTQVRASSSCLPQDPLYHILRVHCQLGPLLRLLLLQLASGDTAAAACVLVLPHPSYDPQLHKERPGRAEQGWAAVCHPGAPAKPCAHSLFPRWRRTFAVMWRSRPQAKGRSFRSSRMEQLKAPRQSPLMALGAGQLGGWPMGTCWPHSWLRIGCEGCPSALDLWGAWTGGLWASSVETERAPPQGGRRADDLSPAPSFCLPSRLPSGH